MREGIITVPGFKPCDPRSGIVFRRVSAGEARASPGFTPASPALTRLNTIPLRGSHGLKPGTVIMPSLIYSKQAHSLTGDRPKQGGQAALLWNYVTRSLPSLTFACPCKKLLLLPSTIAM